MAPKQPPQAKTSNKGRSSKTKKSGSIAGTGSRPKSNALPSKQIKPKPGVHNPAKPRKKQKIYTDKELGLPTLNMITPAGIQKPRGKKKGKIFVDDQESMATILAIVNAEKEGQIESKMMKARQMEEIREARRREAEAKQARKKEKLEETKKSLKKNKSSKQLEASTVTNANGLLSHATTKRPRKTVSFA